jgi:serine/threonine-protein kinase
MDFGIAWASSENEAGGGGSGGFQGSPSYMSPEQVASQELDHRSDIYSLAVTLYEAATGRRAVEGSSIPEITHKVATEYPLPPAGLPPFFQGILLRAMAKDPATRYSSAAEMAGDLRTGRAPILSPVMAPTPLLPATPTASLPRNYLGPTPNPVAAPSPSSTSAEPLENWMPPPMPQQERFAPWLSSPAPQSTAAAPMPVAGLLTCRAHPALAGIARCGECGHPLCYHCLLETPTRGVICRSCGFGPKPPPSA